MLRNGSLDAGPGGGNGSLLVLVTVVV